MRREGVAAAMVGVMLTTAPARADEPLFGCEWRKLHGDPTADPASVANRTRSNKETAVNFGRAGNRGFTPDWSLGAALQNKREIAGLNLLEATNRINRAWYGEPAIHYDGRQFVATFTTPFQLPWAHDYANAPADRAFVDGIANVDGFEKYRFHPKIGSYF